MKNGIPRRIRDPIFYLHEPGGIQTHNLCLRQSSASYRWKPADKTAGFCFNTAKWPHVTSMRPLVLRTAGGGFSSQL